MTDYVVLGKKHEEQKAYEEAAHWYRLAADQGDAEGQACLGKMYLFDRGVTQDDSEALHWFRLAAEQGLAEAQRGLGFMYRKGRG